MTRGEEIAGRIERLIDDNDDVTMVDLGMVLGVEANKGKSWKYQKFRYFMGWLRKGQTDLNGLQKIADKFGVPLDYLLTGEEEKGKNKEDTEFIKKMLALPPRKRDGLIMILGI